MCLTLLDLLLLTVLIIKLSTGNLFPFLPLLNHKCKDSLQLQFTSTDEA